MVKTTPIANDPIIANNVNDNKDLQQAYGGTSIIATTSNDNNKNENLKLFELTNYSQQPVVDKNTKMDPKFLVAYSGTTKNVPCLTFSVTDGLKTQISHHTYSYHGTYKDNPNQYGHLGGIGHHQNAVITT